jgi:hypothetical protein
MDNGKINTSACAALRRGKPAFAPSAMAMVDPRCALAAPGKEDLSLPSHLVGEGANKSEKCEKSVFAIFQLELVVAQFVPTKIARGDFSDFSRISRGYTGGEGAKKRKNEGKRKKSKLAPGAGRLAAPKLLPRRRDCRAGAAAAKAGQSQSNRCNWSSWREIVCKYLKMKGLQDNQWADRSSPVKLGQTSCAADRRMNNPSFLRVLASSRLCVSFLEMHSGNAINEVKKSNLIQLNPT